MITKKEVSFIKSMLLQPHGSKLINITVPGGTGIKVTDYSYTLLQFYSGQYAQAHPEIGYKGKPCGKIGLSRFLSVMVKYFAQQENWIWKDFPKLDKYKYDIDLLYAIQCVKTIFNAYLPDTKIRTQSDALICLIAWNLARIRELSDGEECKGFVDYNYMMDNGIVDDPIPSPIILTPETPSPTPSKICVPVISPSLKDLFEETDIDLVRRNK